MTKITVNDEEGRPLNPHNPYSPKSDPKTGFSLFDQFAIDNKTYPAPGIKDTKEGEFVEAELVEQYWYIQLNRWFDSGPDNWDKTGYKLRKVWKVKDSIKGTPFDEPNCFNPEQPKEQEKEKIKKCIIHDCKCQKEVKTPEDVLTDIYKRELSIGGNKHPMAIQIEAMHTYAAQQTASKDARIAELEARARELEGALTEAKKTIKNWHDISGGKEWDIYDKHSPEMKSINNALTHDQ